MEWSQKSSPGQIRSCTKGHAYPKMVGGSCWRYWLRVKIHSQICIGLLAMVLLPYLNNEVKSQTIDSIGIPNNTSILKAGISVNNVYFGYHTLGFEHKIKRNWSYEFGLGMLPYNPSGNRYASFLGLFAGTDIRYHFAFQKKDLEGFYVGPQIGLNFNVYNRYRSLPIQKSLAYWGQIGLSIGFQKCFWNRLSFDLGAKAGYTGMIYSQYHRLDGTISAKYRDEQPVSLALFLAMGYKF